MPSTRSSRKMPWRGIGRRFRIFSRTCYPRSSVHSRRCIRRSPLRLWCSMATASRSTNTLWQLIRTASITGPSAMTCMLEWATTCPSSPLRVRKMGRPQRRSTPSSRPIAAAKYRKRMAPKLNSCLWTNPSNLQRDPPQRSKIFCLQV